MGVRTQITLTESQYALLKRESARTGASMAELIRAAISSRYSIPADQGLKALKESKGAWSGAPDGAGYVEALRPGYGNRMEQPGR